jgi:hypothetical protein
MKPNRLIATTLLVLGFGGLAVAVPAASVAHRSTPTDSAGGVGLEHTVRFAYDVELHRSAAYPSGRVGPVEAPTDAVPAPLSGDTEGPSDPSDDPSAPTRVESPQVIFRDQVEAFDLAVVTETVGSGADGATLSAERVLTNQYGWTERTVEAVGIPLVDGRAELRLPVDIQAAQEQLAEVEDALGAPSDAFELRYDINLERPEGERLVSSFTIGVDELVRPSALLVRHRSEQVRTPAAVGDTTSLFGRELPSEAARTTTRAILVVTASLAILGLTMLMIDPRTRRRAVEGSLSQRLVSVESFPAALQTIEVADLAALGRIARQEQRVVLRCRVDGGGESYAVVDGDVLYVLPDDVTRVAHGTSARARLTDDAPGATRL